MATLSTGLNLYVFGELLVKAKGPMFGTDGDGNAKTEELGLTAGPVIITPQFKYRDIRADDFGEVPPETFWMLGLSFISMTLVDVDDGILNACIQAAMGGQYPGTFASPVSDQRMAGAGLPMGNNQPFPTAGGSSNLTNSYIQLDLVENAARTSPYSFPFCHLSAPPLSIPLSVERSLISLQWRSIPYTQQGTGDLASAGTYLWKRTT